MTKNKSRPMVLLAAGLLCGSLAQAQDSKNATGGDAMGSGGTVSYSVGEAVYTTHSGSTGTLAQGVQQAYEIISVGTKETTINISLSAFPNPTADHLTLEISDFTNESLYYQVLDMQGKMVSKGQILSQQTQIDMGSLATATYYVNVLNPKNKKIQSFKIIKN